MLTFVFLALTDQKKTAYRGGTVISTWEREQKCLRNVYAPQFRHLQIRSNTNGGLTLPGNRGSCLFLKPLPGIYPSDTYVRHVLWLPLLIVWKSKGQMGPILCGFGHFYDALGLVPIERRCHVTAGVAKQANTSSVLLKWVRWGLATAWPRHWPHIRTCPLWVLAADVWLVWHAATSVILETQIRRYEHHF